MIAKEGFFTSLTLLGIILAFVLVRVLWINPIIIVMALILAAFFNPFVFGLIWGFFEALYSVIYGALGGIAGGPVGGITGVVAGFVTAGVMFLFVIATRIVPFLLGFLFAFIIAPMVFASLSFGCVSILMTFLFAYFILYYLIFGNELAIWGMIMCMILLGAYTWAAQFVIAVSIACLAGGVLGIALSSDMRAFVTKLAVMYYLSLVGLSMLAGSVPLSECPNILAGWSGQNPLLVAACTVNWILYVINSAAVYFPLLAPVNLIMFLFIMGMVSGDFKINPFLYQLIGIVYILYAIGSVALPSGFDPFTSFLWSTLQNNMPGLDRVVVDAVKDIMNKIPFLGEAAAVVFGQMMDKVNGFVGWVAWGSIFGQEARNAILSGVTRLANTYSFSIAAFVLVVSYLFDVATGLTGYSAIEALPSKLAGLPGAAARARRKRTALERGKEIYEETGVAKEFRMRLANRMITSALRRGLKRPPQKEAPPEETAWTPFTLPEYEEALKTRGTPEEKATEALKIVGKAARRSLRRRGEKGRERFYSLYRKEQKKEIKAKERRGLYFIFPFLGITEEKGTVTTTRKSSFIRRLLGIEKEEEK